MFAAEIERELRMLEEYVVIDEDVDDDLGENLIAKVLGPEPQYAQFSPKPTTVSKQAAPPDPNQTYDSAISTLLRDEPPETLPDSPPPIPPPAHREPPLAAPARREPPLASEPPRQPAAASGYDIHSAETLILDRRKRQRRKRASAPPPPPPSQFDDQLHSAPTMILDSSRPRRKKR
jgi:hypothetical protein